MDTSGTAMKFSKKRKKHPDGKLSNNSSKKKKIPKSCDDSTNFLKKKKPFSNKKSQIHTSTNLENSSKYDESKNVNVVKKLKNKKMKIIEIMDTGPLFKPKESQKSKKNKKFQTIPQISAPFSKDASPAVAKTSKLKKKKKFGKLKSNLEEKGSENDNELSDICISDDNESDEEVLREEIQNSSIFKQIEKLMKKAPHLNPANAGLDSLDDLSDADNSPGLISSMESDSDESTSTTDNKDVSSSESDLEDSDLKDKSLNEKQNTSPKKKDKNILLTNKKSNLVESVAESTCFNRTPKDIVLKRNICEKNKKGEMSSNLKNKVQEKLAGAKFRFLNEKLYTETGKQAFKYFQENTEEFDDYHSGYRLQVSKWPINPVNEIIEDIQKIKKTLVIADLGCGEAKIAQTFPSRTIHSFDLVPLNEFVKACDISKLPLPNESVDVAVFCLSLMGTNLKDYLCEAFRILKVGGILKIAEVESRIEDLGHFINYLKSIGFTVGRKNTKHKMFVFLDLKKEKQKCKLGKVPSFSLRPCLYKKR